MAVEIIWSEAYNGYQISDNVVYEEVAGQGITPAFESLENQLYIRHTGASKIFDCGFYVAAYDSGYTGGATREADISELLSWGNDTTINLFVDTIANFAVDDTITGVTSGAVGTLIGTDAINLILTIDVVSGEFSDTEDVGNGGSGSATVSSISDGGIFINQNYLDSFADYTVLNVDDSSSFVEGLDVTGTTSGASATVVKVETGKLIVSYVQNGPFQVENITDTGTGDTDVTSIETESAWVKFENLSGNDKTHPVQVTVDAVVGGPEAGQVNGEIVENQSVSIKLKLVVPSTDEEPDLIAYTRQFATALTYSISN